MIFNLPYVGAFSYVPLRYVFGKYCSVCKVVYILKSRYRIGSDSPHRRGAPACNRLSVTSSGRKDWMRPLSSG